MLLLFSAKGLDHIAEQILSYLDAKSLCSAEIVSKEWNRVVCDGMLWLKLIDHKVSTDPLWRGLSERKGWCVSTISTFSCFIGGDVTYTGSASYKDAQIVIVVGTKSILMLNYEFLIPL